MNPLGQHADPLAGALRDIHLPPGPGFWPPAPGWWIVAALALFGAALAWRWSTRVRAPRRFALHAIAALRARCREGAPAAETTAQISMLLRRVALRRFARERVAGLAGTRWIEFLDQTGGGGAFSAEAADALARAPYARGAGGDVEALLGAAERWLRRNA